MTTSAMTLTRTVTVRKLSSGMFLVNDDWGMRFTCCKSIAVQYMRKERL